MKSKTSCYDSAISHATIKRFAPIALLYAIGLVLVAAGMVGSAEYEANAVTSIRDVINYMPLCNLVYAVVLVQLLMGDLYTTRLSFALRSLPVTLGGWYGTQVTLGILSVVPGILLSGGILLFSVPHFQVVVPIYMASTFLSFLFFFGTALLSAACAGNRIGMVLFYAILNFSGLFFHWVRMRILSPLIYGMYLPNQSLVMVPVTEMLKCDAYSINYKETPIDYNAAHVPEIDCLQFTNALWVLLAYAAVGCVLIGVTMYLLRKRKPECAGDLLAFRATEPVLLVICSIFTGIGFHVIAEFFSWPFGLPMILVGIVVGYYAMLMLLRRQTNVFTAKSLLPVGVMLLLTFAIVTATGLDLFGITYRVPEANQVEQVSMYLWVTDTRPTVSSDPADIALAIQVQEESLEWHREIEAARPLLERIYGSEEDPPQLQLEDGSYERSGSIDIEYTLKNGSTIRRLYTLYGSFDCIAPLREKFSAPEYVFRQTLLDQNGKFDRERLLTVAQGVTFTCWHTADELTGTRALRISEADVSGLMDAILRDCAAGNMAQSNLLHNATNVDSIDFYYTNSKLHYTEDCYVRIFPDSTNTLTYLQEHGYHTAAEE